MRVHFTGGCGRATGSLALSLMRRGWEITASDEIQYAPMSDFLRREGLRIADTYSPRSIDSSIEVVVKGNHIAASNVEVKAAKERGIEVVSMAVFLERYLLPDSGRIVVAGTNGKTTTTAMLAWILQSAGVEPDYLFAGDCPHFRLSVRMRGARWVVLEGDEYSSSAEERSPKFHHYHPDVLVLTNLSYDHAEVYPDLPALHGEFRRLVAEVPPSGKVIVADDSPRLVELVREESRAPVVVVGRSTKADVRVRRPRRAGAGVSFEFRGRRVRIGLPGVMNATNAALAMEAALEVGVAPEAAGEALSHFRGIRGRMETVMETESGAIILDEGYHPEAIRANLSALRRRYPGKRLLMALLPRFTGGRGGYQERDLPGVLTGADEVLIAGLFDPFAYEGGPFSTSQLAARLLAEGVPATVLDSPADLPENVARRWRKGDVLICSLPPGHESIAAAIRTSIETPH